MTDVLNVDLIAHIRKERAESSKHSLSAVDDSESSDGLLQ